MTDLCFVAANLERIRQFLEFSKNVHDNSNCTKQECALRAYLSVAWSIVFNEQTNFESKLSKFIDESLINPAIFMTYNKIHEFEQDREISEILAEEGIVVVD